MRAIRVGFGSVATLVLVAGLSLATPAIALGSDGFIEQATTTYVVNAEQQRLDVTVDLTFRNTKKSTATTLYYYNGDYIWLEKDARNIRGSSPGETITISKVKTSGQYTEYRFRWEPVLYYGKTRKLHITYQIPTGAPRSASGFRISTAYLDFCVIGTGLDGGETVVKVPVSYAMTVDSQENGRLNYTIDGDTRTYRTGTNGDAYKFWACMTGERPARFASTKTTAPSGREIDIQAWPDDPGWAIDISKQIDEVLKDLEALTGQPLPGKGPIAVREVGVGTLGQYAGFFDPDTGVARIGEDLEAKGLVTHELSHAWFNGALFQSHWLSEGYAEWARTSIEKDTCPAPTYPGAGSPNLESWQFAGPRATDEELAVIDYQYAAACALVLQVAARIGDDGMRTVLDALINHRLAYRDGASVLTGPFAAASWKTWLDAVDELGLAKDNAPGKAATVADLLAPYGITSDSRTTLATRAAARDAYHALDALLGDWLVPPLILQSMAGWHYEVATTAMTTATKVFEESAAIADVLPGASGSTGEARTKLEGATSQGDLDAALAAAEARLAAAHEVADARAALTAPRDLVMQAGLIGVDLQPSLDAAVQAINHDDPAGASSGAQAIQAALAGAPQQGQLRLIAAIGTPIVLLLLIVFLLFRRGKRRRAHAAAMAPGPGTAALDAALAPPAVAAPSPFEAPPPPPIDQPPPPPIDEPPAP
jgi:hypothetical protein